MFSPKEAINIVWHWDKDLEVNSLFQQMSKKMYTHEFKCIFNNKTARYAYEPFHDKILPFD